MFCVQHTSATLVKNRSEHQNCTDKKLEASMARLRGSFLVLGVFVMAVWFLGVPNGSSARKKQAVQGHASEPAGAVEIQMRNVHFRLANDIVLEVRALRGQL